MFIYDTDDILTVMKEQFSIPDTTECRLWQRYMTNIYELLTDLQQTMAAGIYSGQVSSWIIMNLIITIITIVYRRW